MNPILKVRDVCLSYHTLSGETPALSHISFDLMPGEFLSIVGPSGCGKSTSQSDRRPSRPGMWFHYSG